VIDSSDEIQRELEWHLSAILRDLGFVLWSFEVLGRHTRAPVLRVFIDRDGGIGVEECAFVNLSLRKMPIFEELMGGDFQLEVSSPGVFRELTRPEHFQRFIGSRVRVLSRGYPPVTGTLRAFSSSLFVIDCGGISRFIPSFIVTSVNAEPLIKVK
jgi:ribosome maturation factor RimP